MSQKHSNFLQDETMHCYIIGNLTQMIVNLHVMLENVIFFNASEIGNIYETSWSFESRNISVHINDLYRVQPT